MQIVGGGGAPGTLMITTFGFWLIAGAAIVALRVIAHPTTRSAVWAGLNLAFLFLALGKIIIWLLAGGSALYFILLLYRRTQCRLFLTIAIIAAGTFLFVAHKSAMFAHGETAWLQQLLTGIGFSFVFLRVIDLVRALQDGRLGPPTPAALINYLVPFHMLAAGPIQAYSDFAKQADIPAPLTDRDIIEAADRVARGLFKKFVLAFALQKAFLTDLQADGVWLVIEIQLLLIWLYLDFSAYSDIAVGLGRLMGVATPENFNRPWLSRNLIDFWDRWHISLSLWIRRNMFIPAQLNLMRRYPKADPVLIASVAIGVSFFMAGIWHGFSRGWLLWGVMHAIGLVAVRVYSSVLQKRLSPERYLAYRNDPLILYVARALTLEYVAIAFAIPFILK